MEIKKTPSQRLRGVIYRLWEKQSTKKEFEDYYNATIEKLIGYFKNKLDKF